LRHEVKESFQFRIGLKGSGEVALQSIYNMCVCFLLSVLSFVTGKSWRTKLKKIEFKLEFVEFLLPNIV